MNSKLFSLVCLSSFVHTTSYAAEVDIAASIGSSIVNSKVESSSGESDLSSDSYSISPSVAVTYTAKKLAASVSAEHQYIKTNGQNDLEDPLNENSDENFTSYSIASDFFAIENLLSFNFSGEQEYVPNGGNDNFVNDEFFNSDNLAKTRRTTAGFNFQIANGDYLNLSVTGSSSNVKSGQTTDDSLSSEVDSDSQLLNVFLTEGNRVDFMGWRISSNYQKVDSLNRNDFVLRRSIGSVYFGLSDEFRFLVTGTTESNTGDFQGSTFNQNNQKYDSYGAGFIWSPKDSREIELTYNRINNNLEQDESYIGSRIAWRFSSRTNINAQYERRFFGETGSFQFNYNTRSTRSSITYNETVSTFSTLSGVNADVQTFVCPLGETDIAFCFQPDTLNYELEAGEEFTPLVSLSPEITEEVRITKSLRGTIGFQRRRLRSSLTFSRTDTDFLESERNRKTNLIGLTNSLNIGARTVLSLNGNYQDIDQLRDAQLQSIKTVTGSFSATYNVNPSLSTTLRYSYTKRDSELNDTELTSKRIWLSLIYRFN